MTIHLTSRSLLQPLFLSIGWCLKSKVQFHYSHMCIAGSPCIWICYCWKVGINTWSLPDFELELICKALLVIDSNRDSVHIFLWRFLGFSVRPFAGFPGYSYLPNPTAAAAAATPVTPTASGPERVSAYYDYSAAAHQQQQQPQATPRPEHTVNNSDPHATVYRTSNNASQRKQSCAPPPPRTNRHQQMMLRSEMYTSGGEDHGVKAYVTGTSSGRHCSFTLFCLCKSIISQTSQ